MIHGYRWGPSRTVYLRVDPASADIACGDILAWGSDGSVRRAVAGDSPMGVSYDCASPEGVAELSVLVEVSEQAVFIYSPLAGTVHRGLIGRTMDVGGPRAIDTTRSRTGAVVVEDVDNAGPPLLYVRLRFDLALRPIEDPSPPTTLPEATRVPETNA